MCDGMFFLFDKCLFMSLKRPEILSLQENTVSNEIESSIVAGIEESA
jgi:hypothetical protein